jgi:hypothetical protein
MQTDLDKTLDQLEGIEWGEPTFNSHLVINCCRLRRVPLKDFTVEDLRLMIGQAISPEYLVPLALGQLELDPMVSGDYYDGDLLESVQRLPSGFWEQHPEWQERWRRVQLAVAELPPV